MNIKVLFLVISIFLLGTSHVLAQTNSAMPNPATKKSLKETSAKSSTNGAIGASGDIKKWRVVVTYGPTTANSHDLKHTAAALKPTFATTSESVAAAINPTVAEIKTTVVVKQANVLANKPWTPNPMTNAAVKKTSAPKSTKAASSNGDWTKTWSLLAAFNTSFNSNLEHDPVGVKAAGFAPSLVAGYQLRSDRHRIRFIYGLSGSRYTRSTDLNRVGNYFGASYRLSLGRWSLETEGEAMFKGTNDDRETNNQFIATQKLGYRFNDKTRATVYYAYRLRRFPTVDADRNAVNPMYGFKFERKLGDNLDWELGYRYDQNRAINPRQNYVRSTYSTAFQYRVTKKDLFETGFSFRPRLYSRLVDVGNLSLPRRDRKFSFNAKWRREFERFGFEFGYGFEKQNSNDIEKLYNDHQIDFSIFYHWGNGETLRP